MWWELACRADNCFSAKSFPRANTSLFVVFMSLFPHIYLYIYTWQGWAWCKKGSNRGVSHNTPGELTREFTSSVLKSIWLWKTTSKLRTWAQCGAFVFWLIVEGTPTKSVCQKLEIVSITSPLTEAWRTCCSCSAWSHGQPLLLSYYSPAFNQIFSSSRHRIRQCHLTFQLCLLLDPFQGKSKISFFFFFFSQRTGAM